MIISIPYKANNELLEKYPKIEKCLKCGVCSVIRGHSCHVMYDREKFSPTNTFVYNCFTAEQPTKNLNIWLCVSCHKCEEICPYDVSPVKVIESLKEASFEQGFALKLIQDRVEQILRTGVAFPIDQKVGVEDLAIISKATGLERKMVKILHKEI